MILRDYFVLGTLSLLTGTLLLWIIWYANVAPFQLTPLTGVTFILLISLFEILTVVIATILSSRVPFFYNFARFGAVGVFNTALDTSILTALTLATGVYQGNLLAGMNAAVFSFVTILSYFLNRHWSFSVSTSPHVREFLLFTCVVGSSMFVNTLIVFLGTTYVNLPETVSVQQWITMIKFIGATISAVWNFAWLHLFMFAKHSKP